MTITDVRVVAIPVGDQEKALAFYTGSLDFTVQLDGETPAGRWLVVAPPDASTGIVLVADADNAGSDTGIRLGTPDAAALHQALSERGVTVSEVLAWDGVPPMFTFDDPDGNRLYVVQDWA
jgi:lactoylglutathione lyase